MEACCVLDITLQADTTCADLTQVMGATAGLASQEQQHAWGCHQTPGAEQVPEEEDGGGGTSCCTEPHACSSSGECPSPSWRCQQKAWTSLLHLSPLPVRLQCLKQAWIFVFTQHQRTSQKAIVLVLFSFPHR